MYNLKAIRKEKGMTSIMVCQKVGCSPSTLSLIETGKRKPSVNLAKRIASVLDLDWTEFYNDVETSCTDSVGAAGAGPV